MTLQVNSQFVIDLLANMLGTSGLGAAGTTLKLDIFSGDMPEVDDAFVFASGNYAAQKLMSAGTFDLQVLGRAIRFNTMPPSAPATATGTATWFAIYNTNPTSTNRALIGSITDAVDNTGVLTLDSIDLVSGKMVTILELGVRLI